MKLYKLTDANGRTRNNTQWGENITHTATGDVAQGLCSDAYIHAYEHPLIAVMMNPAHGNIHSPRMYECEGEIIEREGQLKCGCRELTTLREMAVPSVTPSQRTAFGILCALDVYSKPSYVAWANDWLTGKDRSARAAAAEEDAAARAARARAWAAAEEVAAAAPGWAAAWWAARAAAAGWAAAEEEAAWAAEATATAWAAEKPIDFVSLAEKAMNY